MAAGRGGVVQIGHGKISAGKGAYVLKFSLRLVELEANLLTVQVGVKVVHIYSV